MPGLAAEANAEAASWSLALTDAVTALAWSPGRQRLAAASAAGETVIVDGERGQLAYEFTRQAGEVLQLQWSPDDRQLAGGGQDGVVRLWDAASYAPIAELKAGADWIEHLVWSPDGNYLAAAAGKVLRVWDRAGELKFDYDRHASTVTALHWQRDSQRLLTACYRGVRLFSIDGRGREPRRLNCLNSLISAAWSPNGRYVCAGSQDREVHFWDLKPQTPRHMVMRGYLAKVNVLAWARDNRRVATAGGRDVVIWRTEGRGPAGSRPDEFKAHTARITSLAYQHAGAMLASGASDGRVCVWNTAASSCPVADFLTAGEATALQWSPGDRLLVVGDRTGRVTAHAVGV